MLRIMGASIDLPDAVFMKQMMLTTVRIAQIINAAMVPRMGIMLSSPARTNAIEIRIL